MGDEHLGPWLLQEDGDPSYDIHKEGLAYKLKRQYNIENLQYSA